ncbi:MAG TPA: amino acid permease [Longimicrobiales bacterium]|nr:amino acid permease [Longimicrobiales bacterium]
MGQFPLDGIGDGAMTTRADEQLVRGLGLRQLTANIFNYTVGSGIFVLPGIIAAALGPPALLAYLLCALIMGLVVLVFAEAGSRVAITGGPYAYVEVGLGAFPGFLAGVLICLTDVAAFGAVATVMANLIARALHVEGALWVNGIILVMVSALAAVNINGLKSGSRLIEIFTFAKLVPIFFFVIVGAFFVNGSNLSFEQMPSASNVARTAGTLIFAFAGIEAALLPSGEVRNPSRTVPLAAIYALGFVTILYLAVQAVALGVLGPALATDKVAPLATAARTFSGNAGRNLLLVGAGVSMFGWLTGSILAGPRAFFALSRDGFLPKQLASVHPRFRTPHVAIVLYAILAIGLAWSGTFERLAVLSNIAALGLYFMCAISVVILRRRDVRSDGEPFRIPGGVLIPVLACAAIIWVMIETITQREVIALAITFAVGLVGFLLRRRERSA